MKKFAIAMTIALVPTIVLQFFFSLGYLIIKNNFETLDYIMNISMFIIQWLCISVYLNHIGNVSLENLEEK